MGVVEGFAALAVAFDLVAFPQAGEVGAFEQEFADELGQVGGVGVGAGQGAQAGDAAADLVAPVLEQLAGRGVEEHVAGEVALPHRPVLDPGVQCQPAGVGGEDVHGAADHVGGVGPQAFQQQFDAG